MFIIKNIKKIAILFVSVALIQLAGCRKYEDGPLLNIFSKESRIDGTWDVEFFSINGIDSTSYLKGKSSYGKYVFSKKEDKMHKFAQYAAEPPNGKLGYWEFKNKKKDLYVHFDNTTGVPFDIVGPYGANDVTWEIRRLKTNELWLKTVYNGREFYVKFKLIVI